MTRNTGVQVVDSLELQSAVKEIEPSWAVDIPFYCSGRLPQGYVRSVIVLNFISFFPSGIWLELRVVRIRARITWLFQRFCLLSLYCYYYVLLFVQNVAMELGLESRT